MFKRVVAFLLAFAMLGSYAYAADSEDTEDSEQAFRISDDFVAAHPNGSFSLKSVAIQTNEDSGCVETEVIRQGGATGDVDVTLKAIDVTAKNGEDYTISIPGLIFNSKVDSDTDNTLLESGVSYPDQSSDDSDQDDQDDATSEESSQSQSTGLRAVKEQATGVASDRSKFTYTSDEQSELLNAAQNAADDFYDQVPGTEFTLSFGDGEREKSFYINPIDDDIPESEEQFILVITGVSGGGDTGSQKETSVNIIDDEPYEEPEVGFSDHSYTAGSTSADITLVRTAGVNYYAGGTVYTSDDSALAGEDYTSLNQSFLFAPGQTTLELSIPVEPNASNTDKDFYVYIEPNESCKISGDETVQVLIPGADQQPELTAASLSTSAESLSDEEDAGVTLGTAQEFYDQSASNYTKVGDSRANFFPHSGGWMEINIMHDNMSAGIQLNRTLYKNLLESVYTDMTLYEIEKVNHFDVWVDAHFTSQKTVRRKVGFVHTFADFPTFAASTNLIYDRNKYDIRYPNLLVMDRSTPGIGDDPFNLAFYIRNGNDDYGAIRLYSVTLNFRHFKFQTYSPSDTTYTFDFSKDTDAYTTETVTPGKIKITDDSGQKVDGIYTSENQYTLNVTTENVLSGYHLKELRFYDNTDTHSANYKSYPMDTNGNTLTVDSDFIEQYGDYTIDGGDGARTFLIEPIFVRDTASLTVSQADSDRDKGEILGVDFDASAAQATKTYTKNNTDDITLHVGDKVMLTGVGSGADAVTGFYVTTGDGSTSGQKTEVTGEHSAGIITLTLSKSTEVTPIFGERKFEVRLDPDAPSDLTGQFTMSCNGGTVNFTKNGELTDVSSGEDVDIAVIPPAGYTVKWSNRSGDTNGNGVLDDDEIRDKNGVLYQQYDYDGDGILDADYSTPLYGDLFSYKVNQPQTLFYYSFVPIKEEPQYNGQVTGYVKTREYNIRQGFTQVTDNNGELVDKLVSVPDATIRMGGSYNADNPDAQVGYSSTTDNNGKFSLDVSGIVKNANYILSIDQNDSAFYVDDINPSLSGNNYIIPTFSSMKPLSINAIPVSSSDKDAVLGSSIMLKDVKVKFVLLTASLQNNVKVNEVDFRIYSQEGTFKSSTIVPVSMNRAELETVLDETFESNDTLMVQLIDQNGGRSIEYDTGYQFQPPLPATTLLPSFETSQEKSIPIFGTVMGALDMGLAAIEDETKEADGSFTIKLGYDHAFDEAEKVLKDTIEGENDDDEGKEARDEIKEENEKADEKSDSNVKTKSTITNNLSVKVSLEMNIKYNKTPPASAASHYYFGNLMLMVTLDDSLAFSTTVVLPVGLSIVTTLTVGGAVTGFLNITPITQIGDTEPMQIYADKYGNFPYYDSNMFKTENYSFHAEGGVILQPKLSLSIEGDYGVASVEVGGSAEFFLVFTTDYNDRGTVTLNANINVKVLGFNVYDKDFVNWKTSLFSSLSDSLQDEGAADEQESFTPISRDYLANRSTWMGTEPPDPQQEGPGASDFTENTLLDGVYPEPDIQLARINDNSILMVFVDDDTARSDYNRAALYYSISNDNGVTYSQPVLLSDDGTLDSSPRLVDTGDKILCLYSSLDREVDSGTSMEEMLEANELEMRIFDKMTSQFEGNSVDVTHYTGYPDPDNEDALLGDYNSNENGNAVYDPVSGKTLVIYTKSDYTSADADRTFSASDLFNTEKNYSTIAYRIYDADSNSFLSYSDLGYPSGVTDEDAQAQWDNYWYGQEFMDTGIVDSSLPDGGISDPLVYNLTTAIKGQTAYIAYVVDMDNDLETAEDRDIYLSTYNFADNTFTTPVKASDIYGSSDVHADGRPQLIPYGDNMYLFYTSDDNICYVKADVLLTPEDSRTEQLPSEAFVAMQGNDESQTADDYKVLSGDDGKLYLIWSQDTLRYADGTEAGTQDALDSQNEYHEDQIYASVYNEDYSANFTTEDLDTADTAETDDSMYNPDVIYGQWSQKVQLTAGPGSYNSVSADVMGDGRVLMAAKKSELTPLSTEANAPLISNDDTAKLVSITLIPAVRAEMADDAITFDPSLPTSGETVNIYASFQNNGLMPLVCPTVDFASVRDGVETPIGSAQIATVYGGDAGMASITWTVPDDMEGLQIKASLHSNSNDEVLAQCEADVPYDAELSSNLFNLEYVARDYYQAYLELSNTGNQTLTGAELVISRIDSDNNAHELKRVALPDEAADGDVFCLNQAFQLSNSDLEQVSGVNGGSASIKVSIEKDGVSLLSQTGTVVKDISDLYGDQLEAASGVSLSMSECAMTAGSLRTVTSAVLPAEAADNFSIVYASSDTSVATVSEDGTIKALKPGNTTITAYAVPTASVNSLTVDGHSSSGDMLDYLALDDCPSGSAELTVEANSSGGSGTVDVPDSSDSSENGIVDTTVKATTDAQGTVSAAVSAQQISTAAENASSETSGIRINVDAPSNAGAVKISLPSEAVKKVADNQWNLTVSSSLAELTFDQSTLSGIIAQASGDISITLSSVDQTTLSEEAQALIGQRPVFSFCVNANGETISNFDGTVTASVPYQPGENEDPNSIVIYYINDNGDPELVSNCKYDAEAKAVVFTTSHFSQYAVGYHEVSFSDVEANAWYRDAVSFLAARDITSGTDDDTFSPSQNLTRGQALTMLMRAYGIAPDETAADNFSDAGNTYYTGYLAAAKRLGISGGVGDNKFEPEREVTRQELFVMVYNILQSISQLPEGTSGGKLSDFSDAGQVASWAQEAMERLVESGVVSGDGELLMPLGTATRGEMAQVLYNLLSK